MNDDTLFPLPASDPGELELARSERDAALANIAVLREGIATVRNEAGISAMASSPACLAIVRSLNAILSAPNPGAPLIATLRNLEEAANMLDPTLRAAMEAIMEKEVQRAEEAAVAEVNRLIPELVRAVKERDEAKEYCDAVREGANKVIEELRAERDALKDHNQTLSELVADQAKSVMKEGGLRQEVENERDAALANIAVLRGGREDAGLSVQPTDSLFDLPPSDPGELELARIDLASAQAAYEEAMPDGLDNAPVVMSRDALIRARRRVEHAEREELNRLREPSTHVIAIMDGSAWIMPDGTSWTPNLTEAGRWTQAEADAIRDKLGTVFLA